MARPPEFVLRALLLAALSALATAAVRSDSAADKAVPKGNAAWLYVETQQHITNWTQQLKDYNLAAGPERAIRVLYVYSMDLEVSVTKPIMGALTLSAAKAFRSIPYVTHVGAIIDGLLTEYANLNSISTANIKALADAHAKLYCNASDLDGIQLDLEPYSNTYKTAVLTFVQRLSQDLRDTSFCVTKPKFLAFFVGPRQADAALYTALGPNGYAVISGYDLDSPGLGLPETVQQYGINLASSVKAVVAAAATSKYGKYSIGLPFAASACEFTTAISRTDPNKTIAGYPMYSPSQPSYVPTAFNVLNQTLGAGGLAAAARLNSSFLGVSVWGWLSRDVVVSGYRHAPKNALDTPGMATFLAANMPRKEVMV